MQIITIWDFLLLPAYFYIFYIIVKKQSLKYIDPQERKYYLNAFYLRMLGSFAYSMLVQYYYGYGDSFVYFHGSNFFTEQIGQDPSNIKYLFASHTEVHGWYDFVEGDINYSGYFDIDSSLFVMKIAAVLSYLSFGKFLIISLFFGFFSFLGQWRLYKVFTEVAKLPNNKFLAWAILYTPSIWFWGSGLMKDSICIGSAGFMLAILYRFLIKKKFRLIEILFLVFCIFLLANIKSYILIIITVGLVTSLFLSSITSIKNIVIRATVVICFLILALIGAFFLNIGSQLQALAEDSQEQTATFQKNYEAVQEVDETSKAGIEAKEINGSIGGLLMHAPIAVFNCLYRPFLWESRKIMIFFTALESTLLLLATLYLFIKLGFLRVFKEIFSNPYLLFSLIVSILFALIIGFTTYNFGTMIRYKIILLPFYYFLLVKLYYVVLQKSLSQSKHSA